METLILALCVVVSAASLAMILLLTAAAFCLMKKAWAGEKTSDREEAELPEEAQARKAAAEAQRLYEQGFVNLMNYDGSPKRKEERDGL